ncbi:MAG: SAM-dependent DNA methyltransferase [Phycisphaerales bacterium]|nr:MAG: SAM-dependent DNA methyltransferase [Phycisphaerales bacterium]
MAASIDNLERKRLILQSKLDQQKSSVDRNKLGQFATPTLLARDIVAYGVSLLPSGRHIQFFDPAIGTGAFYSALRAICPNGRVARAAGFEIDPHYGLPATELWRDAPLDYTLADFTKQKPDPRYNLIICNPPYVRHHHLTNDDKLRLQHETRLASGMKLSGLAGLYCHFLGLAHAWMARDAVAGWLIPSEFMDVNYGAAIKRYLLDQVTLLHIHRFDPSDVQFADALVSSAVVWFQNTPQATNASTDHRVKFTFGGSLTEPRITRMIPASVLREEAKWTRFPREVAREANTMPTLGDFFKIKRGIATGGNSFFILTEADARKRRIPRSMLRPILPSPRYVPTDLIDADDTGSPMLDRRLFLLDTRLSESEIERRHPSLWAYLQEGRAQGLHEGYICRHRPLWYAQEQRPPAPIVCTYLGRSTKRTADRTGRPFRFIRNRSKATVANVYLAMYPTPALQRIAGDDPDLFDQIWRLLNEIDIAHMLGEGRVYGGGLHKLEPKELAKVPVPTLADLLPTDALPKAAESESLFALVTDK